MMDISKIYAICGYTLVGQHFENYIEINSDEINFNRKRVSNNSIIIKFIFIYNYAN
jgi:hypothetical protein